jgi:hypothetical protein
MSNGLIDEGGLQDLAALASDVCIIRLAETALHHLARAKAAEEARDLNIAERDEAYRQRDEAKRLMEGAAYGERIQRKAIADARTILGATDGEMLSDAAGRVASAVHESQVNASQYRAWLSAAALAMGETYHSNVPARVAALVRETVDLRARLDADAEAEPAQTFHFPARVIIDKDHNGRPCASVEFAGTITDPAFFALTGEQYARLALVVTCG